MKIRFQADADLNEDIVMGVIRREPKIDFPTATAAGLRGIPDHQVLALAARDGRILISHDWETMPYHFSQFIATQTSPGVLIVPQQLGVRTAIEELTTIWGASEAEEYINRILRIPF